MEIENPLLNADHDADYQYNELIGCEEYHCTYCRSKFNSCEGGLLFDEDTYCNIECLIDNLTREGIVKEI